MQSSGSVPDIVAPSVKDADWESNSVASTPLPDQNFEFLIPPEDTRPRPRSAGGTNRPTKSEEVDELVRFFETHDGPDAEQEQPIQQQNSRSYNIALGLFKAGRRRVRQFTQPKTDRWVKRETVEGRSYRYIAVPDRLSVFDGLSPEGQEPENPNSAGMDDRVMNHGDWNNNDDSVMSPPFLGEIGIQHERGTSNPGDHFYPGIGELPPLIGFSLPLSNARDTTASKESDSHKITERQNSTPSVQSERSNQERTPARVRFDMGTTGVEANRAVSRYKSTKINGSKNNNDDRREDEIKENELSKTSASTDDAANFSALLLRATKNRADTADSTESSNLNQDVSFHSGSSESPSSAPGMKSLSCGTNRSSPSPPRALNPGVTQGIEEKRTWRRPTRILQQGSSSRIFQDHSSRSLTPSSHAVLPSTSTRVETVPSTQPFDEYFLPHDMTSSLLMQPPTGSGLGGPQSQYTFPDFENDSSKNLPASPASNVPYNGSPTSPPRPAPTKPLPSLPKNKIPRGSTPNQENDAQSRSHTQPNGSHSNVETKESQSPGRQGKLAKSPSRSIRRSRSALSRSHIKLHEGSTPVQNVSTGNRSDEGGNQHTSSTPSRDEQKLSAERQERISRAERVYAVRMKDICAARARLENKMLEVREAGGDAMADEFTLSESRMLGNQEAEREGQREAARGEELIATSKGSKNHDGVGRDNDHNAMFSQRLPTTTPSPPPKVPLPADPPLSLLGAFSIESILRGSSNPSHRRLEMSPVMTVYDQWPIPDGNPQHHSSVYRSNSKTDARHTPKGYQKTSFHRDTYAPHARREKRSNALPRPSSILTNGKATPPRSTSPSLASLDGEQPGHGDSSANATTSDNEWKAHVKHHGHNGYGTPDRQANGTTAFNDMTSVPNDDYIPHLSPRARSTHSRTKTAESHFSESRHQQPHPHPQPHQQRNSNTIQSLESRVAILERQNKMLQAALMSALDVGVTLDAENVRGGTPMRKTATGDGYDFGQGVNSRLKRNSNIISRRPNSWLSVRSAQSRRSMGATSSGSEETGVKAIEAMIGNLELGWSGNRQSTDVHEECSTPRDQRVQHET